MRYQVTRTMTCEVEAEDAAEAEAKASELFNADPEGFTTVEAERLDDFCATCGRQLDAERGEVFISDSGTTRCADHA